MLFRRKRPTPAAGPSGPVRFGLESLVLTERRIGAAVAVQSQAAGSLARLLPEDVTAWTDGLSAAGYGLGRAATGRRAAVVVDTDGLRAAESVVADAVRARTPLVVHLVCRDDWSAALSAGAAGAVVLVTPDVRDIPAMAVAAHRAAEETLLPVVCIHDAARVARAAADIPEPDAATFASLLPDRLGSAGGFRLLFDEERPAVPAWIDPDRPLGIGARLDGIDDVAASAGRSLFVDRELGDRVDLALAVVADALQRPVHATHGSGTARKSALLIAAGPLAGIARSMAGDRRQPVVAVACTRLVPFPAERIAAEAPEGPGALLLATRPGLLADALVRTAGAARGSTLSLALYAAGSGLPTAPDLQALADRVREGTLPAEGPVFVGAWRPKDRPGIPEGERLEQRLKGANPEALRRLVQAPVPEPAHPFGIAVGPVLSDLVADELAHAVSESTGQPVRTTAVRSSAEAPATGYLHADGAAQEAPNRATVIVAESSSLLDRIGVEQMLATGGAVLVPDPEHLSYEAAGRIRRAGGRLYSVAPHAGASHPLDLPVRLLQAFLRLLADTPTDDVERIGRSVVSRLHGSGSLNDAQTDRLLTLLSGLEPDGPIEPASRHADPLPPSVLRASEAAGERLDDPARFWRTFGFAHATGRHPELLPDPYRAVGALPVRAGWTPEGSGMPPALPRLIPERCTGCGACWTACPESAILPVAPSLQAAVDTAFDRLAATGEEAFQLGRVRKPLVQEAYRILRDDALHQFRTLDVLVGEALDRVMTRAKLDAAKRDELLVEFAGLSAHLPPLGLARTEAWFDQADAAEKGSGRPLMLAVDPDRCTACGICVEACPETALEPVETDVPTLQAERLGAAFAAALPPLPSDVVDAAAAVEPASRLLDRRAAQAAAGGDGAPLRRASIRAVAVAAEALRGPAMDRFADRVTAAREAVEEAIRSTMAGTVAVNDFEAFSRRLADLGGTVSAERLAAAAESGASVDAVRLRRLTESRTALAELEERLTGGEGRARLLAVFDGQDRPTWPLNPYGFPWMRVAPGSGPAVVGALADELLERTAADVALVRHAEALARRVTDADRPSVLGGGDLDDAERAAVPEAVLVTDRLSEGAVSLLQGNRPVRVLLLRSDPTAADAGDPAVAAAVLGSACVVQGGLGDARHLTRGLEAALTATTPSLVSLHAPDGMASDALLRATEAIRTRIAPLFVYRPSADGMPGGHFDLSGNPAPDGDWAIDSGRPLTPVTWMIHEPSWRGTFHFVAQGEEPADAVALVQALEKPAEGTPIVPGPRRTVALVPERALAAARRRLQAWRRLRALAAVSSADVPRPAPAASAAAPATAPAAPTAPPVPEDVHARLTARLLALSGFAPGQEGASRSLRTMLEPQAGEDS